MIFQVLTQKQRRILRCFLLPCLVVEGGSFVLIMAVTCINQAMYIKKAIIVIINMIHVIANSFGYAQPALVLPPRATINTMDSTRNAIMNSFVGRGTALNALMYSILLCLYFAFLFILINDRE